MRHLHIALLTLICLALATACSRRPTSTADVPRHVSSAWRIAVAPFTQPLNARQLIVGQIPEGQGRITHDELLALDRQLREVLITGTQRNFTFIPRQNLPADVTSAQSAGQPNALPRWIAYGKKHDAQLLLVPQVLDWHQRQGSGAGVTHSAHVRVEFFLLNVEEGGLMNRSIFEEKQVSLTENLLTAPSFIRRGGTWVPAETLAGEGMRKAVRDLGL